MRFLRVERQDGAVDYLAVAHITRVWFSGPPEEAAAEIWLSMPLTDGGPGRFVEVRGAERLADLRAQLDALAVDAVLPDGRVVQLAGPA